MTETCKRLILLAIDMEDAADDIRTMGMDEARQHADELAGAAKTVRQWAREIDP